MELIQNRLILSWFYYCIEVLSRQVIPFAYTWPTTVPTPILVGVLL